MPYVNPMESTKLVSIAKEILNGLQPKKIPFRVYGIPGTALHGETETVYTITLTEAGRKRLQEALDGL